MWNFLKFNLYVLGGSILTLLIFFLLIFLTSDPKGEPNTVVLFLLNTIGLVAVLGIFASIAGFIADFWKVFVQGGEIEGFSWKPKSKSTIVSAQPIQTKERIKTWDDLARERKAKKLSAQIEEPVKTQQNQFAPNDPLGIR